MLLYHVVTPAQWAAWEDKDRYESPNLEAEGFIHLCTPDQLRGVIERYYSQEKSLLLLHLNSDQLEPVLKWEEAAHGELFPHLFGPINKSAIEKVAVPV